MRSTKWSPSTFIAAPALPILGRAATVRIVIGALGGWPPLADAIIGRVAATLTPIALFVVDFRFRLHLGRDQISAVGLGLLYKLALLPAVVLGVGLLCGEIGRAHV